MSPNGSKPTVIMYRHRRPVYLRQRNCYCLERFGGQHRKADQKAILHQASDQEFERYAVQDWDQGSDAGGRCGRADGGACSDT
jgi:hypothetical protein